eukprot:NP_494424.3 Uncharacterized protein CELE_C41H7.2 [Caenorhabditis elegans]
MSQEQLAEQSRREFQYQMQMLQQRVLQQGQAWPMPGAQQLQQMLLAQQFMMQQFRAQVLSFKFPQLTQFPQFLESLQMKTSVQTLKIFIIIFCNTRKVGKYSDFCVVLKISKDFFLTGAFKISQFQKKFPATPRILPTRSSCSTACQSSGEENEAPKNHRKAQTTAAYNI